MTHNITPKRPWTSKDDARLAELKADGRTHAEVAHDLGRTTGAVSSHIHWLREQAAKALLPPVPVPATPFHDEMMDDLGRRAWTPEDDARLGELGRQDLPDVDIAAELGRTTEAVQCHVSMLRPQGNTIIPAYKRPPQWTPERVAGARDMRADDLSPSQIAFRLGTDAVAVDRVLRCPETTEDSHGEGVRVARTVPDHNRTAVAVEDARAALARAQARHREAMEALLEPVREAMHEAGLIGLPTDDPEEDAACRLVDHLRRRGIEMRRMA